MHIWTLDKWKDNYELCFQNHRRGLCCRFDNQVDLEVKKFCKKFCRWLRKNYFFPQKITIYIKADVYVKAKDGDQVSAIFYEPGGYQETSYIKIATGDYQKIRMRYGSINAIGGILGSIAHELTHYFQWINSIHLTNIGYERQATVYSQYVVHEYFEEMSYNVDIILDKE